MKPRFSLALCICILPLNLYAQPAASERLVHTEMHNILYHFTDSIAVHIVHLEGELVPVGSPGIPVFDDPNSFLLEVRSAEISITTEALANALNQYAFAAQNAPLKAIKVSVEGDKLRIRGRLHSTADLPFESEGSLAVTPDGEIRVHIEKVKAAHLQIKGLMDLLGANIAKLIDTKNVRGVRAERDDLILTPAELFPPPHIHGKLAAISIRGDEIVQQYGPSSNPSMKLAGNYMAYRGAQLRFGRLTMSDTDLILIDLDPSDPFDFYLEYYKNQLTAGYTKNTLNSALRSYFRDYNKLTPKQKPKAH